MSLKKYEISKVKVRINGQMPNLIGQVGLEVIPQLENLGYRVDYKGVGKIIDQFPKPGVLVKKDQKIYLRLKN